MADLQRPKRATKEGARLRNGLQDPIWIFALMTATSLESGIPPLTSGAEIGSTIAQAISSAIGIAIVDPRGMVLQVNGALCDLLGKPIEQIVHAPLTGLVPNLDLSAFWAQQPSKIDVAPPVPLEATSLTRSDGTQVRVTATGTPFIVDGAGGICVTIAPCDRALASRQPLSPVDDAQSPITGLGESQRVPFSPAQLAQQRESIDAALRAIENLVDCVREDLSEHALPSTIRSLDHISSYTQQVAKMLHQLRDTWHKGGASTGNDHLSETIDLAQLIDTARQAIRLPERKLVTRIPHATFIGQRNALESVLTRLMSLATDERKPVRLLRIRSRLGIAFCIIDLVATLPRGAAEDAATLTSGPPGSGAPASARPSRDDALTAAQIIAARHRARVECIGETGADEWHVRLWWPRQDAEASMRSA